MSIRYVVIAASGAELEGELTASAVAASAEGAAVVVAGADAALCGRVAAAVANAGGRAATYASDATDAAVVTLAEELFASRP